MVNRDFCPGCHPCCWTIICSSRVQNSRFLRVLSGRKVGELYEKKGEHGQQKGGAPKRDQDFLQPGPAAHAVVTESAQLQVTSFAKLMIQLNVEFEVTFASFTSSVEFSLQAQCRLLTCKALFVVHCQKGTDTAFCQSVLFESFRSGGNSSSKTVFLSIRRFPW